MAAGQVGEHIGQQRAEHSQHRPRLQNIIEGSAAAPGGDAFHLQSVKLSPVSEQAASLAGDELQVRLSDRVVVQGGAQIGLVKAGPGDVLQPPRPARVRSRHFVL